MLRRSIAALALVTAAAARGSAQRADTLELSPNYWRLFWLGATTSLAVHEAAHVATALAVGGHPSFGFNAARPTIYSGLDASLEPHKQFLFSAAGLVAQSVVDEGILDVPHSRGSAFERGVLAGGIGTTLFYLTIGRTGSVSDVAYMARTHAMSKRQIALLFGGIAGTHMLRIWLDPHYANFFARPRDNGGGVDVGVNLSVR
jgi:hypothetical protein